MTSVPAWYEADYRRYCALAEGEDVRLTRVCDERGDTTPLDPWYFYQDTWAASKVLAGQPAWLLDVGSTALLVGLLSLMVPVVSVDVRPLAVTLPNLTCKRGDVTALPFGDGEAPMVSSLSVVEHVGLGRYGDALDPRGSERACRELARVLAPGGRLLLSVPVADAPVTLFNMHRLLSREQVRAWLGMTERDGILIQGNNLTVWCAEFVKA